MVKRSADHRYQDENDSRIPEGCQIGFDVRTGSQIVFRMRVEARAGTLPGCNGLGGIRFPGVSLRSTPG